MKNHDKVFLGICILMFVLMTIITFGSQAQSLKNQTSKEYHDKLQKERSWQNYQTNWKKNVLANAKEVGKSKRNKRNEEKANTKFFNKVARLKD